MLDSNHLSLKENNPDVRILENETRAGKSFFQYISYVHIYNKVTLERANFRQTIPAGIESARLNHCKCTNVFLKLSKIL
jgi:hypothetical protein